MLLKRCNAVFALAVCSAVGACGGSAQAPEPAEPTNTTDLGPHRTSTPAMDEQEEDDGVRLSGTMGRLEAYEVQRGIEPHAAALSACYHDNLKRRRYIGGQVELLLIVDTDGTVKRAGIAKSSLGAFAIERCLAEVASGMHFASPEGGVAEVRLPLSFEGVGRLTFWDAERVEAELAVSGEDDQTDIRESLAVCVEETGARPPRGGVVVTAYVANRGRVRAAGFAPVAEEAIDPLWAECAHAAILTWRLSDPRGRVAKISFSLPSGS